MTDTRSQPLALIRHYDANTPLARLQHGRISAGQFVRDAQRLALRLPPASHVINICEDRYHFLLGFAAALLRGQVTLMPSSRAPQVLQRLRDDFPGSYCLADHAVAEDADAFQLVAPPAEDTPHPYAAPSLPASQPAAILFTSGSTGAPVAHAKTWGMLVRGADQLQQAFGATPGSCVIGTVAPQHMFGLESTIMFPLQWGCTIHHARPLLPADIEQAVNEAGAPAWLMTTPLHLRACVADALRLHNIAGAISATMPLTPDAAIDAEKMLGAPLHEIYGCTEAGMVAARRAATQANWRLCPDMTLRQDAHGDWLEGPRLNAPLALADRIEAHGDGRFSLLGRTGDMIKLAGKRTSMMALDAALQCIPGVEDGAFHRRGDDSTHNDHRLGAFFVSAQLSVRQVQDALRARIDPVFMPRPLTRVERLPRDANGKLSRAAIAELASAGAGALQVHGEVAAGHPILAGHFPGNPIVPGVLLLGEVLQLAARRYAVSGIRQAKFHTPLLPAQRYTINVTPAPQHTLKFTIEHGATTIASGMLQRAQGDHA